MGESDSQPGSTVDTARLVARVLAGDETAFETLMRLHFRAAFAVARAHTGNEHDAEDVCQAAFYRAYEKLGECEQPGRFSAWLMRIVRNHAINFRERANVRATMSLDEAINTATARDLQPDAALERHELKQLLANALFELSPIKREIVMLHDVEGLTHGEIGATLEISELMSRRHLSDARRTLRDLLGSSHTGGGP